MLMEILFVCSRWASLAFMKETFPGRLSAGSNDSYALSWLGYAYALELLLVAWCVTTILTLLQNCLFFGGFYERVHIRVNK